MDVRVGLLPHWSQEPPMMCFHTLWPSTSEPRHAHIFHVHPNANTAWGWIVLVYDLSVLFAYRLLYLLACHEGLPWPRVPSRQSQSWDTPQPPPEPLYALHACRHSEGHLTPFAAFLRIVRIVHNLPDDKRLNLSLEYEIQQFWHCGMTGASLQTRPLPLRR